MAVLLPIAVLTVGASALLRQRYDTAQRADRIVAEIPTLNRLANLRQLLDEERIPVEGWLRARQFGFNLPNVSSFLDFSQESLPEARAAMNAELGRLGPGAAARIRGPARGGPPADRLGVNGTRGGR